MTLTPKQLSTLPESPGCYIFLTAKNEILYVGKAKSIKKRVSSYFRKNNHDPKTNLLISKIELIDFIATQNEVEALLLENNLIKKHYPMFNIDLKDSRRYAYIKFTDDEFPILEVVRKRESTGEYFGPFVIGSVRKMLVELLERRFGILTRKPSPLKKKSLHANKEEYRASVVKAKTLLKGNVNKLIKKLESEMFTASQKQYYEHALKLKRQIEALKYLKERQHMEFARNYEADIINYTVMNGNVYLILFNIYKGILMNKQEFEFSFHENFLDEFLTRFYFQNPIPKEIIVPYKVDPAIEKYLQTLSARKIKIIVPQKGKWLSLLSLAKKNVALTFFKEEETMADLAEILDMKTLPRIIECLDISHLRGTDTVASMVQFENGKPNKTNYRKFKIRIPAGGDDFAAMNEVVYRRYSKFAHEQLPLPDLVVIDGGASQLNAAQAALKKLGLNPKIIALAKKLEEIYLPSQTKPLRIDHKRKGLQLLMRIRDEAHRFAISYNRKLRSKRIIKK